MFKSVILGLLVSTVCLAQDAVKPTSFVDNISVNEAFALVKYKGDGDTLVQFLQGVDYKICDSLTANLEVPVYFEDTTNLGAINLNLIWSALDNNTLTLDLSVGVATPMETEFGASSVDPSLGGVFTYNLPWAGMVFEQTFNYEFVTGDAYSLAFGSKVSDDIITADSSILCPIGDSLKFGATVWQNYTVASNGQTNVLAGPNAVWNIGQNVDLGASFAIPVSQDVSGVEQDYVLSANLGIKF